MRLLSLFIAFQITCGFVFSQDFNSHFDKEYFEKQRFAHRGGFANGPENTKQTIVNNILNGVNAIEVDVHLTKDDQLILFHDDSIRRLLDTEMGKVISEMTLEEVKSIPLRDSSQGVQYVCTLSELVDTLGAMIPNLDAEGFLLELDFKPNGESLTRGVDALMDLLEPRLEEFGEGLYDYFFVSSFFPGVLKEINERDEKIVKAYAINHAPPYKKFKAKIGVMLAPIIMKRVDAEIIEPNLCMVNERFVKKWHKEKRNKLINSYTANTKGEKEYLNQFPIAFTTDCPSDCCLHDPNDPYIIATRWCKKCDDCKDCGE